MSENKDSQRWAVIEVVEIIANLIALQSHYTELYQNKVTDLSHPDLFTDEELQKIQSDAMGFYQARSEALEKRRHFMRILKWMALDYNQESRCELKHKIWVYQFSQELLDTNIDNDDYIKLAEESYMSMMESLSRFLWTEIVSCGRCLQDELENER